MPVSVETSRPKAVSMLDTDTFLTAIYVMCDDFCKSRPRPVRPGPAASLNPSEVLTLCIFGQWRHFASERDFYRYAQRHLRPLFPRLPHRSQFNRLQRSHYEELVAFWQHLTLQLRPQGDKRLGYYEAIDATAVPTRSCNRRGTGWLKGQIDKGLGSRIGWYRGFYLLASSDSHGVFTGWGFGTASTKDQPLATLFFQARHEPDTRLATVGQALPEGGFYFSDSGFQGQELHRLWRSLGADVITPPQPVGGPGKKPWIIPWKHLRHWIASRRQIIETCFAKLHHVFRLRDERPHSLEGFMTRLAAKFTLHNLCIALNRTLQRPNLAFADLWNW
jgi:hypothetical protein